MRKLLPALAFAAATLAALTPVQAAPITLNWTATATAQVNQIGLKVGDALSGSFTYDLASAYITSQSIYNNQGYAWWSSTPMTASIKAGTYENTFNIQTIMANNYYGSIDQVQFYGGNSPLGYYNLNIADFTGKAWDNFALPSGTMDLSKFSAHNLYLYGTNVANVTSLTAADVPEPGAFALFGLGLAAFAIVRRRKA